MADVGQTVNARHLANLFNITERRIQQHAAEGVIPKASRGKYPFIGSVKGYIAFLQSKLQGGESEVASSDISTNRARLVKANADMRELDLQIAQGEYLSGDLVRYAWSQQIQSMRQKMLAVPTKMAGTLHGIEDRAEIQAQAKGLIYEALEELAELDEATTASIVAAVRSVEGSDAADGSGS